MKNNWFLSAFIIALAILGISLDNGTVANQEIIIQFSNTETTLDRSQNTLSLVKRQLETIDVDNVKIERLVNGALKVTYYSDIDVSAIKEIVTSALESELSNTVYTADNGLPFEKESETFQLDIYKIQEPNDLGGAASNIIEYKSQTTRSSSAKTYATLHKIEIQEKSATDKIAYNAHRDHPIALNNSSHKIPEVRAGPTA